MLLFQYQQTCNNQVAYNDRLMNQVITVNFVWDL